MLLMRRGCFEQQRELAQLAGVSCQIPGLILGGGYSQFMVERESITYQERYVGAQITSSVLKVFGVIWLVAGAIVIERSVRTYRSNGTTGSSSLIVLAIELAATVFGAAVFAFFAYVLDLLRGIWEEAAGEND